MATTTTNLSLRKPESSDFVNVALDIAGNMQTIDEKWASSAAANIGSAAAAGSALTVARTDHVHTVGSGTVSAPGLPVGESNTGLYRPGTGQLAAAVAGALAWITSAAGLALEKALHLAHIATPSAPAAGYTALYGKSDGSLYKQTPAGTEVAIVDTTATQTLTNKTLTSPTIGTGITGTGIVSTTNLAANAVTLIGSASGSTNGPTTTSATFVDMTDMSVTMTNTGGRVLLWFAANMTHSAGGALNAFALKVDSGGTQNEHYWHSPGANYGHLVAACIDVGVVSAGSHTYKIQWLTATGTLTAYTTARNMIVMELKK